MPRILPARTILPPETIKELAITSSKLVEASKGRVYPNAAGAEVMKTEVAAIPVPSPSGSVTIPSTVPLTTPSILLKEKV